MKRVLVTATNYSKYCQIGKRLLLENDCEIIENPYLRPFTPEELKEQIADIDGVIVGVDSWQENIFGLAPRLKGMARFGVGVDNIDLAAAKHHGITVSNCPGVNTTAVAEQTIALILSLTRRIPMLNASIRRGEWTRPMAHELKNQTIGFLGFGAIARDVAEKLKGFHPQMIAYDKYPNQEAGKQLGVRLCSLLEVIGSSTIISIHLPATQETNHLINQETIAAMQDGVLLVNTARGSIVDEKAVCEALKTRKIGGIGTDVFETEPILQDHPLLAFDEYIATPHTSAETYENCSATSLITAQALLDIFSGKEPRNKLV